MGGIHECFELPVSHWKFIHVIRSHVVRTILIIIRIRNKIISMQCLELKSTGRNANHSFWIFTRCFSNAQLTDQTWRAWLYDINSFINYFFVIKKLHNKFAFISSEEIHQGNDMFSRFKYYGFSGIRRKDRKSVV